MPTSSENTLFIELYKVSLLIKNGIMVPALAFKEISTGETSLDEFFHNFWTVAGEADHEVKIIAQCETLTKLYPAFALVQHVIGVWLYGDSNAFHYHLDKVELQYALRTWVNKGGVLNERAQDFLQVQSLAPFAENPMSKAAYDYLCSVSEELSPKMTAGTEIGTFDSNSELFPVVVAHAYHLTPELAQKITEERLMSGMDYTPASIEADISWYCGVLFS